MYRCSCLPFLYFFLPPFFLLFPLLFFSLSRRLLLLQATTTITATQSEIKAFEKHQTWNKAHHWRDTGFLSHSDSKCLQWLPKPWRSMCSAAFLNLSPPIFPLVHSTPYFALSPTWQAHIGIDSLQLLFPLPEKTCL